MPTLHVLRVFVGEDGRGGNPLGVFLDGGAVPEERRQAVAARLGYPETVYVDDPGRGAVRVHTPSTELDFAGHPLVGTSWLLRREGHAVDTLRPPAGDVPVRVDDRGDTYITGRAGFGPRFGFLQLDSPADVEALAGPPSGRRDQVSAWAWIDEPRGEVRARVFPLEIGITEDEATGAAAVQMTCMLRRDLRIHQGVGSLLVTRHLEEGVAEVGGRSEVVEVRDDPGV